MYDPKGVTGNKLMQAKNPAYGAIIQYYLKSKVGEKEEVKVSILDKSGKVLRELKGPKEAGIQRLAWDLRLEPPFTPPAEGAGLFFFGAAHGPFVEPGEYTVKIAAAGQTVQKTVKVEEDPRIQIPPGDREERFKTMLTIWELQKRTEKVRAGVAGLRTQTAALIESWSKPQSKVPEAVKKSAADLKTKTDAINRRVSMSFFPEGDDVPGLNYTPPSVTQRLLRVMGGLDGYTTRPTPTQTEEVEVLTKLVADLETSWKALVDQDVAALNRSMTSSGVSAISLGGEAQ